MPKGTFCFLKYGKKTFEMEKVFESSFSHCMPGGGWHSKVGVGGEKYTRHAWEPNKYIFYLDSHRIAVNVSTSNIQVT